MKYTYFIVTIFLLLFIIPRDSYVKAETNEHGVLSSTLEIEDMEDDLDFGSEEFVEVPSYRTASPEKKGFLLSVIFTASLWGLFFYLIASKRLQK